MRPQEEFERKLAKVDEAAKGGLTDMKHGPLKWLVGALAAVAAAAIVVIVLELNKPRPAGPAPAHPVLIQIIPAEKK